MELSVNRGLVEFHASAESQGQPFTAEGGVKVIPTTGDEQKPYSRLRINTETELSEEGNGGGKVDSLSGPESLESLVQETKNRFSEWFKGVSGHQDNQKEFVPSVTVAETSGRVLDFPQFYDVLEKIPLTAAAHIQTGPEVNFETPANKRTISWDEIDRNPFRPETVNEREWSAVPLNVGGKLVAVYIHKSAGSIEMEAGLLNLFPIATQEEMQERKPEALLFFGNPRDEEDQFGFYRDEANGLLVGGVPGRDVYKYFGYLKKPLLTLHNCLCLEKGEMPLHCGAMHYQVRFDEGGLPYVGAKAVVADDMAGLIIGGSFEAPGPIFIRGTEDGAFSCTDGFQPEVRAKIEAQAVGYNGNAGTNARRVFKVTERGTVLSERPLDVLLYMNNYGLVPKQERQRVETNSDPHYYFDRHFQDGWRVAAGSTGTKRGEKEYSFWANPFPRLRDDKGKVLHSYYAQKFADIEAKMRQAAWVARRNGDLRIGVAYSQMMAGAYVGNTEADFRAAGYSEEERKEMEKLGPAALAESMVALILEVAAAKKSKLEAVGEKPDEVDVTCAFVGDSRTGKSETLEAMSTLLKL